MGKIYSSVFGGSGSKQQAQNSSQSQSHSENQAFDFLKDSFGGQAEGGAGSFDLASQLLGTKPNTTGTSALENFFDSAGGKFTLDQGVNAVNTSQANKGLLHSGSTLKGLTEFGQKNASTYTSDFLSKLLGLNTAGNQAGSIISGAGNVSDSDSSGQGTSSGSSYQKQGMAKFLGALMAGGA